MNLDLSQADRLLTTTKQVRKRLDLSRPVPKELILECIQVASAAPIGGNRQSNRWIVVDDAEQKRALAELYNIRAQRYFDELPPEPAGSRQARVNESAQFLADNLAKVPALVIPVRMGRPSSAASVRELSAFYGSVIPAVWSFQLAARARGLGSAFTTFHLAHEVEAARILGIPEPRPQPTVILAREEPPPDLVTQICLLPLAYYAGDDFMPAPRLAASEVTFHNRWLCKFDDQ